jgi:hypothetical protein
MVTRTAIYTAVVILRDENLPDAIGTFSLMKRVLGLLSPGDWFFFEEAGGAGGIRTRYLLNANQAFSRVNYGPTFCGTYLIYQNQAGLSSISIVQ